MSAKDFRTVTQGEAERQPYLVLSIYNFTPGRITLNSTNGGDFSSDVRMTTATARQLARALLEMVEVADVAPAAATATVSAAA